MKDSMPKQTEEKQEKSRQDSILSRRKKRKRAIIIFCLLAAFLLIVLVLNVLISPEELVQKIGARNGYIIAFFSSFFAGFSSFTIVSFYSILIACISGGLDPFLLSLIAGTSLSLGDIFLFYFGRKGRDIISGKTDRAINRMSIYLKKRKLEKFIPLLAYVYISFIPLPNDWLLLFLASIRYPHRKMNLIIILGDYTHTFLLTFLIVKGITIFS